MSRSLFSGFTPSQTSHFRLESQSQSNPAPVSPTTEARMLPIQIPHSLRRPAAKPKHQAPVIDKADSKISSSTPGNNYGEFLEWLGHYFALYFSEEFECFLLEEMKILSIQELSNFLTKLEPKFLHDSLGPVIYDRFRQSIVDLQVIWPFLKKSYIEGQSYASYSAFLSYRKDTTRKVIAFFPGSMAYIKPSQANKPVLPAQNQDFTQYHVAEPRKRKPSDSSLFLDRYAMQAEKSYVPPYMQSLSRVASTHIYTAAYMNDRSQRHTIPMTMLMS
jgi:hypothetical protein